MSDGLEDSYIRHDVDNIKIWQKHGNSDKAPTEKASQNLCPVSYYCMVSKTTSGGVDMQLRALPSLKTPGVTVCTADRGSSPSKQIQVGMS